MRLPVTLAILALLSCERKKNDLVVYVDGRQLLTVNETDRYGNKIELPKADVLLPEKAVVGEELHAKVFLTGEKDVKLIDAYFDCVTVDNQSVDTTSNPINKVERLSGCRKGLITREDTIHIAFKPQKSGKASFYQITLLTRDREKIYRTQKFTFDYNVAEFK